MSSKNKGPIIVPVLKKVPEEIGATLIRLPELGREDRQEPVWHPDLLALRSPGGVGLGILHMSRESGESFDTGEFHDMREVIIPTCTSSIVLGPRVISYKTVDAAKLVALVLKAGDSLIIGGRTFHTVIRALTPPTDAEKSNLALVLYPVAGIETFQAKVSALARVLM